MVPLVSRVGNWLPNWGPLVLRFGPCILMLGPLVPRPVPGLGSLVA